MASASSICASCLRTMQQSAFRAKATPPSLLRNASRTYRTTASQSHQPMYLDFLAPSCLRISGNNLSATVTSSSRVSLPHPSRRTATTAAATASSNPSPPPPPQNQQARAIQNPKNDENGQPMLISLSPRAAHRLSSISAADNNPNSALRIIVESGGCHGFQYLMNLVDLGKEPPAEDDCIFEGQKGAKVVIDESSLELLNGSTLDYTMELIGSQFKVTGIPGATSSCGCGTSFDIKL